MGMSRLLLPALLLLLALPTAADAAPPWSASTPIPGSGPSFPSLVVSGDGTALAAWSEGGALGTGTPHLLGASQPEGAAFGAENQLGRLSLTGLATYGTDRAVALGTTGNEHPRAAVAFGRTDGSFGTPRNVALPGESRAVAIAANAAGDVAILVRDCPDSFCRRPTPYLIVRRHGASFGKPIKLAPRTNTVFGAVAINARGDVLAVWERPLHGSTGTRGIYARERTAGGRLGATRRLGTSEPLTRISAALGDGRRAVVASIGQGVAEGDVAGPATIKAAVAAPGEPFGSAKTLEVVNVTGTGRYVGEAGVVASISAHHRPLIAWTGFQGDHFVVRAAEVVGTGLGTPQVVSDPAQDTVLSDAATTASGRAVVIGLEGRRGSDLVGPVSVVAATRAAGATAFGAPEAVSEPGQFDEAAQVAFRQDGSVVAAWRSFQPSGVVWAVRPAP
jgi:hypothetical protein